MTPVPVPVMATLCGLPAALSVIDRVPVREPVAPGLNVRLKVQLAPTARLDPQVVVFAKSEALVPVIEILLMSSMPFPVFVRVTTVGLLVVFTT